MYKNKRELLFTIKRYIMKKYLVILLWAALLPGTGCNNSKEKKEGSTETKEAPAAKPASDITGTYATTENNMPMEFTLNAGGTGSENYHGNMRPFTWIQKDGKVFFKYNGETNEFELPIDMDKAEIHYGSLVYKKK
ncbi:MAG: hypothetical protein IPH18_12190 [Chitinophagaceae bacterium]|nr:hypothetical protein [Chitinophagaceae bacterium]